MTIEEQILQYVVELGPAISAILTIICSLLVSIKKFGSIKKDTLAKLQNLADEISNENNTVKETNKSMQYEMKALIAENAELKREMRKILKQVSPIKDDINEEK